MFFHGSKHKINKFTDDFVGGREAVDQEGPGIYFTSSWNNARSYGPYVYTVRLRPKKEVSTENGKKASLREIEWLMKQAPEWESIAQNWNENPAIGLRIAAKDAIKYNDNPHQQFLQVWIDFFKYHPTEYVRGMTKLGYDIVYIKGLESIIAGEGNITHAIVLNPSIIEFIEMEDDRTEEEKAKDTLNEMRKFVRKTLQENNYRGVHVMHKDSTSSPLHDLLQSGQVAKDFYDEIHHYAYLHNKPDQESVRIIKQARNKPNATVTIYRAVPKGVTEINPGDWVSLSKTYAKEHGIHHEDPKLNMPVISKKVKVKDVWWDGNDVNEFSYFPEGVNENENLNDNFWKWFAGSKVVDKNGNPLIVHHGTSKKFSVFSFKNAPQQIIWFTSNKSSVESGDVGAAGKGHIMDLYASIKNPAGWDEYEKYGLGQLESMGYDGAILPDPDGSITGFVFEPNQLKSVRNKGEWNPSQKSIYKEDEGRKLGKSLAGQISDPFVMIYRAVGKDVNVFKDRDYVTRSKRFAIEHAESNHVVYEEPQHVIAAYVPTKYVFDAYNPGEYFYSGPEKKGKEIYASLGPGEYEGLDENEFPQGYDFSKHSFTSGDCDIYAVSLHRLYGYPLYVVRGWFKDDLGEDNDFNYEDCHIVVKLPNGMYLDSLGEQGEAELRQNARFMNDVHKITIEPIDEEAALSAFSCENQEPKIKQVMNYIKSKNIIKEELNDSRISDAVKLLTKKYNDEYGVSCDLINQGDCENFAEELREMLEEMGIESEILSDGLFFDPFGDLDDDMMWDASQYGQVPANFKEVGLPSHYWVYVNGKHYDSDAPEGVSDMFQLPIVKDFYLKKSLNETRVQSGKYEGCHVSDLIRMDKIDEFFKEVEKNPDYNIEEPEYDWLMDPYDGYPEQTYIQNDLSNGQIIFWEGWSSFCWEGLYAKPEYKGLSKENALKKIFRERTPRIAQEFDLMIEDADFFWHDAGDEDAESGYIMKIVFSKKNPEQNIVKEKFNVVQNTLEISAPYDKIQKFSIGNKTVYALFGDVDYYPNKQSILALKRKPSELKLDHESYAKFLEEFKRRFFSLSDAKQTDLVASIETTSPVTDEMAAILGIPYADNGFKKIDPSIKMKDIDLKDREKIKDLLHIDFSMDGKKVICVMDDFITTGTTFKNAFDKLPSDVYAFGICLFRLRS